MKKVGKMPTLHARISDRGVTVHLDESAVELILREGFSREYGARYLERVMDCLLGDPTAEKILGGKTTSEGILRVTAVDGRGLEFRSSRLRS